MNLIVRPWVWFLAGSLVTAPPVLAQGQIYKCAGKDGNIEFSNMACPANTSMSAVSAKPNAIDMSGMRMQNQKELDRGRQERARAAAANAYAAGNGDGAGANECPSDTEIRNMEAQSGSITLGKKEREFLQAETRRATQCRQGQGNYNAADWTVSRQAQADQKSLTSKESGRMRAEAMHGAANPREAERLDAAREADDQRRAGRQAAALQDAALRDGERKAAAGSLITGCNGAGCWGSNGTHYQNRGEGRFRGPEGTCRQVGREMRCP